jgi:biopolymer transport protein ExbB
MSVSQLDLNFLTQFNIIMEKGGVMMFPLLICSFIVMLITIERLFSLRQNRIVPGSGLNKWNRWIAGGMNAEEIPKIKSVSLIDSILFPLSQSLPLTESRLEERMGDLARKEKHKLEKGLVFLDTIAGIGPLLGLLGTALGMVEVFSRLSAAGEAKMSALSSGISQALFTTVAGLCIGIPALIAFNLFSRHVERILIVAEDQLNSLIDQYHSKFIR